MGAPGENRLELLLTSDYWSSRPCLITGAAGFIGSHLTERLVREGARVRALVHYNSRNDWGRLEQLPREVMAEVEVLTGDVQDPLSTKNAVKGNEVVFHLASLVAIPYSYRAPQSYVTTNVLGTLNVMQAALECGVAKVVHTSTSETYGTALYVPIDEKHPLQGQSPYSASKIGSDKIAESYHRSFGLPVATLRPFNTFGPRQSARAIIPTIITQTLKGQDLRLGSLYPTRDFTYVDDIVLGFLAAATSSRAVGTVINVGSGHEIAIGDLARRIMRLIGRQVEILQEDQRVRPELSEVGRLLADNSKARDLLAWEPRIDLDEGLRRVVAWIDGHQELFKSDIYNV